MASPARNSLTSLLLAAALLPLPGRAADVYLDINGTTAGSGNADTTWSDTAAIWGDALGTATPVAWTADDTAILAAGTDYTGTRTLTVSGTQLLRGLTLSSANTGLGTLTITGGTLDFGSNRGSIDFSAWGTTTAKTLNLASTLAGTGGLEIRSFGNLSASGGGNSARFNLNGTNTFSGDVTILSGLVAYSSNAAFGAAGNRILLNGGGLLDPNLNLTLSRDIEVLAGGGTLRAYGSATMTHAGALVAAAGVVVNRTDGGTVVHSGDLSGFLGTYNVQRGTTRLTGSQTIRGTWNLGEGTTAATLAFNGAGAQRFEGTVTQSVGSSLRIEGTADLTLAGSVTANTLSMSGTGSVLRVVDGANLSFTYLNIGDGGGSSGHIYQTGGTLTIRAGDSAAMRLGHWNNNANRASLFEVSGGTFDASATSTVAIGWDGDAAMIVGGGPGAALFKASAIQLDASTSSPTYDNTLTIRSLGTVEVAGTLNAASAQDRVNLSGGTLRLTAAADTTWGATLAATADTASTLDVGGRNLSLSSGFHTGTGTVNLSSATGSLIFSQAGNHTVPWAIAGTTAIAKSGAGTLTLTGDSIHSGTFAVNAGRLNLAAGAGLASALTLASGTTLGGKGAAANATFQSGSFLNLTPAAAGSLAFGNVSFTGTTLRVETYAAAGTVVPVFSYTGTLTGALGTDLALEGAANYRTATFADTAGAVTLDLGTKNLTWSGAGGGTWNIKSDARFNTDADNFAWGDHVTFSGASANTTVTLAGELRPGSLTVAGDTNYTLVSSAGNFLAGPTSLLKTGSSTLTVNAGAANTHSGGTVLSQGAIIYTGSVNNGLGTGAITLGDAATGANAVSLLLTNARQINNPITVSSAATGTVTLGYSGTGSNFTAFTGGITLQRDLVIQAGTTDRLTFTGAITGTGNITIQGGQRVTFDASNSWTGNLTITGAGTVYQTFNANSIPDTANVTVDSGAIFQIFSSDTIAGLNGAGTLRPIAGKPTLTVGGNNASGTFSGTLVNNGSDHVNLAKNGTGTQVLSGTITSPGDFTLNAGILAVSGTGELSRTFSPGTAAPAFGLRGAGTLRIDAGGNLALRRNADFTGAVNVAGGTLTLGHANALNTATVTLSGGTLAFDNRGASFTALAGDSRSSGTLWTHTNTLDFSTLHNTAGDVTPANTTHAYNGRIYLTAGQWSFAEQFDDGVRLVVAGTEVLNNGAWGTASAGSYTAAADGWYDIDVRVWQGTGGVGPSGGWTKGIGIKKGAATTANADYATFDLVGLASLGAGIVYANDLTFANNLAVTAASTVDTSAMLGTVGSTAVDGNGAGGDVTLSGVVSGSGTLTKTGAGTLTLTAASTLSGALVVSGGTLAVTNTLRNVAAITATSGATVSLGVTNMFVGGHGTALDASRVLTASAGGTILLTSAMESRLGNITLSGGTLTSDRGLSGWDNVLGNVSTGAATVNVIGSAPSLLNGTGGIHLQGVQNFAVADVTGDASADLTVSLRLDNPGNIGGEAGGINKTGAGTLLLTGVNTFRGNITVAGGTLAIASGGRIYSGAYNASAVLTVAAGATLDVESWGYGETTQSLGGLRDNAPALVVSGGTFRVSGATATTGNRGFTVNAGGVTLEAAAGVDWTLATGVANVYSGNPSVTLAGEGTGAFNKAFSGTGALAKTGAGTWSLGGAASHSGATSVNAGTLRLAAGGSLSASTALSVASGATLDLAGASTSVASLAGAGAVALGATRTLTIAGTASTTFSGVISGDGALSKTGSGTLTLSGSDANTFAGGATLSAGTVAFGKASAFGSGTVTLAGATLQPTTTVAIANNLHIQAATTSSLIGAGAGDLMYTGAATGSGTINLNSATSRSVWLQGDWSGFTGTINVTVNAGGTNYRLGGTPGSTTPNAGTNGSDFSQARFVLAGSGTDRALLWNGLAGATVRIGELSGSGGRIDLNRAANWSIGHLGTDSTFSGLIAGTGNAVTKAGAGTLTLSGANTFTGGVTVEAGTLRLGNRNALGAFQSGTPVSQVVVQSGGAIDLNGIQDATYGYTLAGTGVGGAGALTNSGAAIGLGTAQASRIRLAADASIGGSGNWALLAAGYGATSIDLNGFTLTKVGANTVSLVNTSLTAGSIRINSGTIDLSAGNAGTATAATNAAGVALSLDDAAGAALRLNGRALSLGSLTGGGLAGGNVELGGGALTVGALGASGAFDGAISGTGSVTKVGAGTLALSGANTFSGGLAVNGGRIDVTSLDALGTGGVTLGASGSLRLSLVVLGDLDFSAAYAGGFSGTGLLDLDLEGDNPFSLGSYAGFGGTIRLTSGVFDNTGFLGNLVFAGGRLLNPASFAGTTVVSGAITDISLLPTGGPIILEAGASIDFGDTPFTGAITYRGGAVTGDGFQGTLNVEGTNVAISGSFGQGKLAVAAGNSVVLEGVTTGTLVFAGGSITGGANLAGRLELAAGQSLVLGSDLDALGAAATLAVASGASVNLAGAATSATIAFSGGSLAGAQNFTGTLAVSEGATLATDGTVGGTVTLASGTTLAGNGTFTGTVTAGAGSVLAPGSSPGITTYGTLNLTGGSTLQLEFFAAEETVQINGQPERGYDAIQATTLNFGTAGEVGGGTILLQLATLTNWSDNANWLGGLGSAPAEGSSLIFAPGELAKDFTLARFGDSDRLLSLADGLNVTSWFSFDTALFVGTGASGFQVFVNGGDNNWELTLRVVPEPSTYGLILGALALAGTALRRRKRDQKV